MDRAHARLKCDRAAIARGRGQDRRTTAIASFLNSDSADVRALAARILPADRIDLKTIAASDASPLVRAEAMRRLADPAAKEVLLKALESDDPFIQQAARQGLRQSLKIDELIALAGSKDLSRRPATGLALDPARLGSTGSACALAGLSGRSRSAHPLRGDPVGRRASARRSFALNCWRDWPRARRRRNLFEATLAALEQLDGKMRGPRDEVAGEDYIVALLKDPRHLGHGARARPADAAARPSRPHARSLAAAR